MPRSLLAAAALALAIPAHAGAAIDCDTDGDGRPDSVCDECLDTDKDGYDECYNDYDQDGYTERTDCDESDPSINPGAPR